MPTVWLFLYFIHSIKCVVLPTEFIFHKYIFSIFILEKYKSKGLVSRKQGKDFW